MTVDISQVTLDVITAIKEKGAVKFTYKDKDVSRYIKPVHFYGDFDGFEGIDVSIDEYRNCLLYTSPSPRDRQKSRMPSSA